MTPKPELKQLITVNPYSGCNYQRTATKLIRPRAYTLEFLLSSPSPHLALTSG